MLLCLTTQLSVLSARVDGWFFTRRPGYVLLTIISIEMICTTITAAAMRAYPFWYPNVEEKKVRLTALDGRYIGTCWLFAILIFLVMEVAKYAVYYMIELNRVKEIQHEKRVKLKAELRRRMGARRTSVSYGAGGGNLAPKSLAPRSATASSYMSVRGNDGELAKPLLTTSDDSYATA